MKEALRALAESLKWLEEVVDVYLEEGGEAEQAGNNGREKKEVQNYGGDKNR